MTTRINTNWSIAFASPNYTITYASTYDAEVLNADCATIVASTRNSDILLINNTALKYSKCTSPSEASRSALIAAIAALNTGGGASTPDNHYVITTKDEFDTAVSDATTAAVPYRFEIAAGTYAYTSGTVTFPENGTIVGAGLESTKLTANYNEPTASVFSFGANTTVRGITFDHLDNGNTTSYDGICRVRALSAGETVEIRDCEFTQFDATGLAIEDGTAGVIRILNCRFTDCLVANSTAIYKEGAGGSDLIVVHDCLFSKVQYGIFLEGTMSIDIQRNHFTDPVTSVGQNAIMSDGAGTRHITVLNNTFHEWEGQTGVEDAIQLPTSYGSLTGFRVDISTGTGANRDVSYDGLQRIGDERSDTLTANMNFSNDTLSKTFLSITDLIPGTYLFSVKAMITDLAGHITQFAVVRDNSVNQGTGYNIVSGTDWTSKIVGNSQCCNNSGIDLDFSRTFIITNLTVNDYHAAVASHSAPGAATRAVTAEQTGSIATVGDNINVLSAVRIS